MKDTGSVSVPTDERDIALQVFNAFDECEAENATLERDLVLCDSISQTKDSIVYEQSVEIVEQQKQKSILKKQIEIRDADVAGLNKQLKLQKRNGILSTTLGVFGSAAVSFLIGFFVSGYVR